MGDSLTGRDWERAIEALRDRGHMRQEPTSPFAYPGSPTTLLLSLSVLPRHPVLLLYPSPIDLSRPCRSITPPTSPSFVGACPADQPLSGSCCPAIFLQREAVGQARPCFGGAGSNCAAFLESLSDWPPLSVASFVCGLFISLCSSVSLLLFPASRFSSSLSSSAFCNRRLPLH